MTLAHELYIVDKCVHHAQQASSEGFWRLLMAQLVAGVNVPVEVNVVLCQVRAFQFRTSAGTSAAFKVALAYVVPPTPCTYLGIVPTHLPFVGVACQIRRS